MLVDSHCHLNMLTKHEDLANIVRRAEENGVKYLQTICTKLEDLPEILAITQRFPNVYASVGVHPAEVQATIISSEELIKLTNNPKITALGETGLDYFYNKDLSQQKLQRESFAEHIKASCATNLPVIVHTRDAEEDTYQIIADYKKQHAFPGLIHCFTASEDFARKILDLDFYISISGIITFKNSEALRSIAAFVPLERLLVETDSPYLAPVPMRGKTNEPSFVKYVAEVIAQVKGISFEQCAQQTSDNFFRLFNLPNPMNR